jgi:FkbM family methyltransferase
MTFDWARRAMPGRLKGPLKRLLGIPATRLHPDWAILAPIGPVEGDHLILDVGSHRGWFFHCWKDWCPGARIQAFEPALEAYEESVRLYGGDPSIVIHPVGLASGSGTLDLNIMAGSPPSNSFLEPVREAWEAIGYATGPISHRRVPVMSLDEFAARSGVTTVYLLKVDVQGFELEVFKGANATLTRTSYVFVESAIRRLYVGAPNFAAVHDHLEERGFHLMALRGWHRGNRMLVETDMLFRRNDLAPAFQPSVRIVEHLAG